MFDLLTSVDDRISVATGALSALGINVAATLSASNSEIIISHNIIHDLINDGTGSTFGIEVRSGNSKVFNNILYDISSVGTSATAEARGIDVDK